MTKLMSHAVGKVLIFNKLLAELIIHVERNRKGCLSLLYTKLNARWIKAEI